MLLGAHEERKGNYICPVTRGFGRLFPSLELLFVYLFILENSRNQCGWDWDWIWICFFSTLCMWIVCFFLATKHGSAGERRLLG
jgi:hypothetical protein